MLKVSQIFLFKIHNNPVNPLSPAGNKCCRGLVTTKNRVATNVAESTGNSGVVVVMVVVRMMVAVVVVLVVFAVVVVVVVLVVLVEVVVTIVASIMVVLMGDNWAKKLSGAQE